MKVITFIGRNDTAMPWARQASGTGAMLKRGFKFAELLGTPRKFPDQFIRFAPARRLQTNDTHLDNLQPWVKPELWFPTE
ncbi:MAG: hypothetical protein IPK15_23665 [Verrucomicrobia bacterium]|nr:hypothetical protein [Verrucomicrobiota bacterium]